MTTTDDFAERLAAPTPTPGGGAAAARVGVLGCSLLRMCTGISLEKIGDDAPQPERDTLKQAQSNATALSRTFRSLGEADVAAFDGFIAALRLPRATEDEVRTRDAARLAATEEATRVPIETAAACRDLLNLATEVTTAGQTIRLRAASDLTAAVEFARAAFRAAELNIDANLPYLDDAGRTQAAERRAALRSEIEGLYASLTSE